MSRELYNYKRFAIKAAKELFYGENIILQLQSATTEKEISKIMKVAREALWCTQNGSQVKIHTRYKRHEK